MTAGISGTSRPARSVQDEVLGGVRSAEDFASQLAGKISQLEMTASGLETTIGETLEQLDRIPADAIHALQDLDFMRQSLGDIARMLKVIAPFVEWSRETDLPLSSLQSVVRMRTSLETVDDGFNGGRDEDEIWL